MPPLPPLHGTLDHTLLRPDASTAEVDALCAEARDHGFAAVCVHGVHVQRCARALAGSPVAVCTVIGFPHGASPTEVKAFETRTALAAGATELDVVLNIGALREGRLDLVREELALLVGICHEASAKMKVILEACLLSDEEKVRAAQLCHEVGADFVKTSTGFSHGGATLEDVALLRRAVGPAMGVKASGGIRDAAAARAFLAAGATRIGASASVAVATDGAAQS